MNEADGATRDGSEPAGADHPLSPALTPRTRARSITGRTLRVSRYPLSLLTVIYAINISQLFILAAVLPLVKEEFHVSDSALGLLSSSYLIVAAVGVLPFGILADRYRRTRIIGWGTLAWGGSMMLSAASPTYGTMFASRMLLGITDPADNPTSYSLLTDYYPVQERGKVMGIYNIGQTAGVIAIPLAGFIAQEWGWRAAFHFFAIPAFLTAMLAWRLPEPPRGGQDRRAQQLESVPARPSRFAQMGAWQGYREVLKVPTVLISYLSIAFTSFFTRGLGFWTVAFLIRNHDMALATASAAVALLALGALIGSILGGYLSDVLVRRGFAAGRVYVAGVTSITSLALLFPAFATGNTPLMLVLFGIGAAMLIAPQPALWAVRADVLHPDLRGKSASLDTVVQTTFGAVSPLAIGILADVFSLQAAFLIMLPLMGFGGAVLLLLGPRFAGRDAQRMRAQLAGERSDGAGATARRRVERPPATAKEVDRPDDLLRVRDIAASYGPIQVLFGAHLVVPRGGRVAVLGPNGAGKTTLLNVVSGLHPPDGGAVLFKGQEITGLTPEQRVALGLTQVPGGRAMFPTLSVRDNLWMGVYQFSGRRSLVRDRLDAVLEVFPALKDRLEQQGGTLSGGEQQMVALGRALMAGPELLMVDELSLGLAPVVVQELFGVLGQIVTLGTSLLIVEQSVNITLTVAERFYLMERGALRSLGDVDTLRARGDLTHAALLGERR